jgi:hypothetical protein
MQYERSVGMNAFRAYLRNHSRPLRNRAKPFLLSGWHRTTFPIRAVFHPQLRPFATAPTQ